MSRDYYKILLVAASGSGKTYSFRNMDPATTGFINVENKPLPFKNSFKYHKRINTYDEVLSTMAEYAKDPNIKCIVIDSFSAYVDLLLEHCRTAYKNFEIWSNYNSEITRFHKFLKKIEKEVFVTAHYETSDIEGSDEKRVKVKGNEWKHVVEKEYTVVLYLSKDLRDDKEEYFFITRGEGLSAKMPPDIVSERTLPNDSNEILNKIIEFIK